MHFHSKPSRSINNILKIISFKHCHAHFGMSCNHLNFMWPKVFVPKKKHFFFFPTSCNTETPLQTVVNPAKLECPQRIALISIFIEMLSKPLRETHGNQCCLGSMLQKQVSPLLLLLFGLMPFTLIPLKRRWWSHTSIIPAPKEWFNQDCMPTDYNVF